MPATMEQVRLRIERGEGDGIERLQAFADGLFRKADPGFFDDFDSEALYAMAVDGYAFFEGWDGRGMAVDVFNPSYRADGWDSPYSVLRLLLPDRPFIVDSVRAELRRHDLELYHLLHPIFSVVRSESGSVQELDERREAGRQEAFEMFFVERLDDPARRQELEEAVRRVLHDVVLATDDYQAMREQALDVATYLRELRRPIDASGRAEDSEELEEYATFMEWLDDDNFVFLGYREYDLMDVDGERHLQVDVDSALGILRKVEESAYRDPVPLHEIPQDLRERVIAGRVFTVTKTNAESTVHRAARMDYLGTKKLDANMQVMGERRFVGLFTSKAHSTPVDETPILRRKLRQVLELDNAIPESHDWKQIMSVFNSMPRDELFWVEPAALHHEIRTIMALEQERGVRLTLRSDPLARGLSVMVIMPRERFNSDVRRSIQRKLVEALQATHVDYQLAMGEDETQVRFHFFFTTHLTTDQVDVRRLEREVAELTRSWSDHVRDQLIVAEGERDGRRLANTYLPAFDERYKADTSAGSALRDIQNFERLKAQRYLVDILNPIDEVRGEGATIVKVYHHGRSLVLSEVLPVLENLGFRVLDQIPYQVLADEEQGIELFRVHGAGDRAIDVRAHGPRLTAALEALLLGHAENDRLNRLVLYAGLDVRQVALLRTYQMYFAQLDAVTSRRFINDTLLAHPEVARRLFRYFAARFDPGLGGDRQEALADTHESFLDALADVSSLPEDRALRGIFDLMEASQRTNFFLGAPVISVKIASQEVATMPEPRPLYEIAVTGPGVEGTHLRGGKVARGGIRWSDRPDDFRTEVLGLMKTQMTKNAVIVPVGSKGGFVVKEPPPEREDLRAYVRDQYQAYIRGLLDLTDNVVGGETVHPEGLVIYDEPDPYLVVAADKGTATFSDLANATAEEYDFWLGDAFASGGSYGYDHKEVGITARGAWECVERHFREMGVNVRTDPVTVAGIGDMSGDVFGNGLLHTDTIRLQAAFNHLHIFLDPEPDASVSYAERKRLFDLPRSSWRDYDTSLISEGGGVYDRGAKSIPLSPQAREMLDVENERMSGQDLVKAILKARVDLLWNGGIGTYVKASAERNAEVGDSANDPVRVDADELRCLVVGEGGNLGFTQLARVEYARGGGRINTDAIDNSGGVDLSDHEVNIKILLRPLVSDGDLSMVQRNRVLKEMTEDVSALVLRDNYFQSLALSLAERRSREDILLFDSLLEYLTGHGGLDPQVEHLPNRKQILDRQRNGEGFTRPELAILMAYVKMGLYRRLLETDFPDEPNLQHHLFDYFPELAQERFPEAIRGHSLRREIIATQYTNTVVDLLGITFVHRSIRDSGATAVEVIRAALVALEVLDVKPFLERVFALDGEVPTPAQYRALDELVRAVEGIVQWMLLNDMTDIDIAAFVEAYCEPLKTLRLELEELLAEPERKRYQRYVAQLSAEGLPDDLAPEIASFDYLPSSVGVIDVSHTAGVPLDDAAKRFYDLGERLDLGWLRDRLSELPADGKWEKIAIGGLVMDLRQAQQELTRRFVVAQQDAAELSAEAFLETFPNLLRRFDQALGEVKDRGELSLASGGVLVRLLTQAAA